MRWNMVQIYSRFCSSLGMSWSTIIWARVLLVATSHSNARYSFVMIWNPFFPLNGRESC